MRDQVDQQWLQLIANHSARVPLPVALAMLSLGYIATNYLPDILVLAWLATVMLVLLIRFVILGRLPQNNTLTLSAKRRWVIALSALNGIVHAAILVVFGALSDHERLFFTMLLLALCTAATSTTAGQRATFFAYIIPVVGVLILSWAHVTLASQSWSRYSWVENSLPLLIGFYGLTLIGVARATHKVFVESCQIREKEHDLNVQLEQALKQAQLANHAKTRFLAAASHDLRQPLHAQSMLVAGLSLRKLDTRSSEIVRLLLESNETLASLLDGLLDISKLDAGIVQANIKPFVLQHMVTQHFTEMEAIIGAKNLTPILHCRGETLVETDPQLLLRILRNLTNNALKFTDSGSIRIEVGTENDWAELRVIDTGPGIAPQHFESIFQEFYQIDNPERDRTKGLGLGLSIVRRLTELLGIQLQFSSSINVGTEFILRLPRSGHAAPAASSEPTTASSSDTFELLVLVIDDEESVRKSLAILLEELGCRHLQAAGTAEAVRVVEMQQPDLVVADFRLKGSDSGLVAIAAVKQRWPEVRAILVSGDVEPARQREASDAGIRLLHKPLSLEQLKQELRQADESY